MMSDRKLTIINNTAKSVQFTANKTIMNYVIEYIISKELNKVKYDQINHVRLYKKILIPAKIVRVEGGRKTECYCNFEATSILKWKIKLPVVLKPTIIARRV